MSLLFYYEKEGGGGANFATSDDLQIFLGALYYEMVHTSLEHKGSDDFEFKTAMLMLIDELWVSSC